jgi:hypothetical protein
LRAVMTGTARQSKGVRREAESERSGLPRGREPKRRLDEQESDKRPVWLGGAGHILSSPIVIRELQG